MPVRKRSEARSIPAGESAVPATPSTERRRRTVRAKAAVAPAEAPVSTVAEPADATVATAPEPTDITSEVRSTRPNSSEPAQDREEIARLAYTYWQARGGQGGSPEEDWERAEQEIRRRRAAL